ncbi:MAG: hypothetical protein RI557_10395, partial [Salibacter sp.]|nr:hypothetical protein [Salibacter sp.]
MHDPRLGRFFSIDPLASKYPHYTPYSFSGNKVIHAIELEGLEELIIHTRHLKDGSKINRIFTYGDAEFQNNKKT